MPVIRVATYNIHKGVQGFGPARRLEIHNIGHAVEQLDADVVCLQEVRKLHRREERYFTRWPELPQAEFLAPEGYEAVYQTNATTRHGEHGNALLSRWPVVSQGHEDMSDHRFEQRGLLHVQLMIGRREVHVIVLHLGLIAASRLRQVEQLGQYVDREIPRRAPLVVAGDLNDWGGKLRPAMNALGLRDAIDARARTYPSRLPLTQLDYVYARGLKPLGLEIPRGRVWGKMSDHLPLIATLGL
ncbi:MAG TPA: endonuclease/exonuclease/phosphatase family protein [Ramlibacter sp.]|jgi:endonuclease/exonuclease/phosphatase family metal-dependent hydrolase|uniref:endonuclease/exonuclease/phosphatase family protein n=1 Tax=Ramlibacter sp. TaxID=1917967 RepID=UPI002D27C7B1|nr:endonuclease/exonuclease/phosphatase family protein [Ramlibacter sp.]HZY17608.1 endonuclease/exonuclease/phosphatase family protein [Ramlibacter sp.]